MISKNQLKFIQSLRLKKFRDEERAFVAEGTKLVDDLLANDFSIHSIFAVPGWFPSRQEIIIQKKIPFREISEEELKRASNLTAPHEVIAIVSNPVYTLPAAGDIGQILLLLDKIQDPGNLGTIIRTADWFGIRHIICSPDTVDVFNPKVVQATMGSICRVKVYYQDLGEVINELLKGWNIYGADAEGESVYTAHLEFPAAVIIGNESQGISEEIFALTTVKIGIPNYSNGAESLNASVAAGILCFEFNKWLNYRKD